IRTARGNFGLVWVQGKGRGMPEYARWSLQSSREWTEFAARIREETGVNTHYRRPGGYNICLDDDEMSATIEQLSTLRQEARDGVYEYDVVEHADLKRRLPMIGNVAGATYCPHDGHCNPLRLLRALHEGFIAHLGSYRPLTRITRIEGLEGGGFRLRTEGGSIAGEAEKVVISAGHGSQELGAQLGLDVPIHPDQGQVLVTERVEPLLDAPTNYVRQTDEGNFMLGPSSRDVGLDLSTEPGTLRDIAQHCIQAFPFLSQLRVQRAWAALRIMTPDGFPVYQHSESYPGAFSFACHSGVTLAAKHAMVVPQWILDGGIPANWTAFHPRRFDVPKDQAVG
ncbi:MAG: FAD-binding oxidoreductase, partial [Gammaproteobacteria bacterium]|nr:FAD-binding oxidoreductase [Gammaproteobacteria bacterium]